MDGVGAVGVSSTHSQRVLSAQHHGILDAAAITHVHPSAPCSHAGPGKQDKANEQKGCIGVWESMVRLLHDSVLDGVPVANTHAGVAHAVEFGLQILCKRLVGRAHGQVICGGQTPARSADDAIVAACSANCFAMSGQGAVHVCEVAHSVALERVLARQRRRHPLEQLRERRRICSRSRSGISVRLEATDLSLGTDPWEAATACSICQADSRARGRIDGRARGGTDGCARRGDQPTAGMAVTACEDVGRRHAPVTARAIIWMQIGRRP
eukprot:355383-Chlamydomonas_euryale.AAC.3